MKQTQPSAAAVALWLKGISRGQLQESGWITVNKRFHGLARAARPFLQAHFPDEKEQAAAFDGLTLALMAVAHFEDIAQLSGLFAEAPAAGTEPAIELPLPIEKTNE
ncbi:MAG TPA: hypothetical protein VLF71_04445 [Candidatus Saccharimonadales bacterium]|nr:hypothetical protein [Candidatus Saccharimonadales bacterium]